MGPQRTTRRLVSAHHHPHEIPEMFLRRHPMLTRSMAPTQPEPTHRNGGSFQEPAPAPTCRNRDSFQEPAPAPTHRNRGSSQETTSLPSLDTTNNTPSIEHSQSHSSREVSSLLSLANSITTSLHNRITQSHFLQEISNSSFSTVSNVSLPLDFFQGSSSHEAPHPPSIVNITGSDGFDVITSMGELPSKPSVPEELLANFDQSFVRDLDMFNIRSRRLFDEQKESLDFTKKLIDISTHQCIELRAINHLRRGIRKLEHCCPFCKDLAWSPHVLVCGHTACSRCINNERQRFVVTGKIFQCPICCFPVCRKPIPSILIQSIIERIATNLDIVSPPLHSLVWPERQ